jgi:hypothetical protein
VGHLNNFTKAYQVEVEYFDEVMEGNDYQSYILFAKTLTEVETKRIETVGDNLVMIKVVAPLDSIPIF